MELTFRTAHGSFTHSNLLKELEAAPLFKQPLSRENESRVTVFEV